MEMLMTAAEVTGPKFIALEVCKYGEKAKAPNTLKEGCNFLVMLIDEFGPNIPLKEKKVKKVKVLMKDFI